jgi:hypothetical protein
MILAPWMAWLRREKGSDIEAIANVRDAPSLYALD